MAKKRRKRASKTGIVKDKQGRWRWAAGQGDKSGEYAPTPQAYIAQQKRQKRAKKPTNIIESQPQAPFEREVFAATKDVGKSGGATRRKRERQTAAQRKRSEAAKKGAITRAANKAKKEELSRKRSEAAKKGAITRAKNREKAEQKKFEAIEKGKRTKAANQAKRELAGKAKGASLGTTRPGTNKYQNILKRFADKVAAFGQDAMEQEAPVMDGRLQASINSSVEKTSYGYSVSVYPNIYYAEWVNYGTDPYGAVNADYMEFIWKQRGNIYVRTTEVSGQSANPFIDRAEAATEAYVASQEADLADQIELAFRSGS